MHNRAKWCLDNNPHRVGNSVSYREKLYGKGTDSDRFIFFNNAHIQGWQMRKFLLPLFYHEHGEVSGIDGRVSDSWGNIRDASNVVEVSMSNEHGSYTVFALFKIFCVGENIVNTWSVFAVERSEEHTSELQSQF